MAGGAERANVLILSTEAQVYAFDLGRRVRISIGRHESNDLRLASRTVSNYHAEILNESGSLLLRDLDSTNGTFVNGRRVQQRSVATGDRIRIGSHILTVHVKEAEGEVEGFLGFRRDGDAFGVGTAGRIISLRAGSEEALKTLQAREPSDLSLPDLLKLLTMKAACVVVVLERKTERGRIFVHKDRVVHAEYGRARGEKALYRMFGWQQASYTIEKWPDAPVVPRTIELPTDTLLYEGMKHAGELGKMITQLPPLEAPLRLREDCPLPLTAHSPAEIEIYKAIIRYETIARVLEESPLTDLRTLRLVQSLLRKGVFELAEASPELLDETFAFRPSDASPPAPLERSSD